MSSAPHRAGNGPGSRVSLPRDSAPLPEAQCDRVPHAKDAPCHTGVEGVFVAGTATGPKDIVDSIVEAGAAASEAAMYMKQSRVTSQSESKAL